MIPEPPVEAPQLTVGPQSLVLTYLNDAATTVVKREYTHTGEVILEVETELIFNYQTSQWEEVTKFRHRYPLNDDQRTLAGDGSNWDGTDRFWKEWFTSRHYKRLKLRFPNDSITEQTLPEHQHRLSQATI